MLTPGAGADTFNTVSIRLDGKDLSMVSPALMIESTTYVPFLEFGALLGASAVSLDLTNSALSAPDLYVTAGADDYYIVANGRYLYAPTLCRVVNSVLYVPIRPLAKAFCAAVGWDRYSNLVVVFRTFETIESGDSFYNETDLYWMSRIISAESRGESVAGKIAVGNVVMNRLNTPYFPNSIRGVIFDRRGGVQFTPAYSGSIERRPGGESIIAAKLVFEGVDTAGESLYFNRAGLRSWASRNRPYVTTIGNHDFFG